MLMNIKMGMNEWQKYKESLQRKKEIYLRKREIYLEVLRDESRVTNMQKKGRRFKCVEWFHPKHAMQHACNKREMLKKQTSRHLL